MILRNKLTSELSFISVVARQQKFLRAKNGGVEDEMHDDAEGDEEHRSVWGRSKNIFYNAENVDYEVRM